MIARNLANQGKLDEALNWCDQAIVANPFDDASHYLRAAILHEEGRMAEAIQSFKRALSINPEFILAHFALGNIARERKNHREANRHYRTVMKMLKACPLDGVVPQSEGLTASRLSEIVITLMETEGES